MIIWLNGELLDAEDAHIDPSDRGFTLGDGLFETIAVRNGGIVRLDAHCARLQEGCKTLGIPYPTLDLQAAIESVLVANKLADAIVRLTLSRGVATRGLVVFGGTSPTLLLTANNWPGSPPPARCIIASVTQRNEQSPLARIKSLNYLDNILAQQEAVSCGANEAILLNTKGFVAEATISNLFIVNDGRIFTPPIKDGALPGIMRAAVMEACECMEKSLEPNDVYLADGIFLTNSLGIRTVTSLDGKPVGNAARAFMEDVRIKLTA